MTRKRDRVNKINNTRKPEPMDEAYAYEHEEPAAPVVNVSASDSATFTDASALTEPASDAPQALTLEELDTLDAIAEDYAAIESSSAIPRERARAVAKRVREIAYYMERKG